MLDFAIFAFTFVVGLLLFLFYVYPSAKPRPSTVPGDAPSDEKDGNLADIAKAGSLHQYLTSLHERYGSIASFWWGPQYVVSLCSGELFKQCNHLFDRPRYLFMMFEPLITLKCIQYANGKDGKYRRTVYDQSFSHEMIVSYYTLITSAAKQLADKWSNLSRDEHVPLGQYMAALALKSIVQICFGGFFLKNENEILEFKKHYDICWEEMESRLKGDVQVEGDGRKEAFENSRQKMYDIIRKALDYRRAHPPSSPQEECLIDAMISSNLDEDAIFADALVYIVGGFHTTGNLMTWCLYHLARDDKIQQRVYEELIQVIGEGDDISPSDIPNLNYGRQVIDETMRWSTLAPWAARYSNHDMKIGGHIIPKETPIIHALGVASNSEDEWSEPDNFNADRFSNVNAANHHPFAFKPFGFAGKRVCPGYRLAYAEAHIFLSVLLRKFKITLANDQVVNKTHGLVTHPEEEIWIHLQKR